MSKNTFTVYFCLFLEIPIFISSNFRLLVCLTSKVNLKVKVEKVRSFHIKKVQLWTPGKKKRRKKKLLSNISPNYPRICRPCHGMSFRFHFTFYGEKKEREKWEIWRGNKEGRRRLSCCSCFLFLLSLFFLLEWKSSFCAFSKEKKEKGGEDDYYFFLFPVGSWEANRILLLLVLFIPLFSDISFFPCCCVQGASHQKVWFWRIIKKYAMDQGVWSNILEFDFNNSQ